jgi:predicted transcriptional regulator
MADEYNLRDQRAAMAALDAERRRSGMSLGDMEEKSGVSVNSVYAWRSCARSPTLCNAVAIAETFGFEIIMRRKTV